MTGSKLLPCLIMGFVIGTAGHIDHGKSTLVRALTGVDPDRLVEEKRRGITIELGFAELDLGDGIKASFVDVPGHEALVRTMVAGATGMDAVLLVVAADEGVMPQTREHLAIVDLLGLNRGVVALTKADRVDEELLELAELELREILEESGLSQAPIVAVAAPTGQGIDELKSELIKMLQAVEQGGTEGIERPFRLPIDRSFSMRGFGTVVTGSSRGGRVAKGDTLEALPGGLKVKVRGLQKHNLQVDSVEGSNRLAVNLQGVDKDQLQRGMVLATPGTMVEGSMIDVAVRLLPNARDIDSGSELMILAGTTERSARIYWIGEQGAPPKTQGAGARCWAQLRLGEPMVIESGENLILRRTVPDRTVGGARVLDPLARKYKKKSVAGRRLLLKVLDAEPTPSQALAALALSEPGGVLDHKRAGLRLGLSKSALATLHNPELLEVTGGWIHRNALRRLAERLYSELERLHEELPLRRSFSREDLKGRLKAEPELLDAAAATLLDTEQVESDAGGLKLKGHEPRVSDEQRQILQTIESRIKEGGFEPPNADKLSARPDLQGLLHYLLENDRLVRVNRSYLLHADIHADLLRRLNEHFAANETMDTAAFKDMTGLSRKLAIPLLEHLDAIGLTRRRGDLRIRRE